MKTSSFMTFAVAAIISLVAASQPSVAGPRPSDDPAAFGLVSSLHEKVSLFMAGSVPLGQFGSADPAIASSGFAYPGVGGGVEYTREFIPHLGVGVTGMFVVHGYDVSGWKNFIPYWHFEGDSRVVYALTAGPMYDLDLSSKLTMYAMGQVGMLHVSAPNLLLEDQLGEHATLTSTAQVIAGYKLSLGATLSRFDANVQFMYGEPEFTETYEYRETQTHYPPEKLPVRSVMLALGYVLN